MLLDSTALATVAFIAWSVYALNNLNGLLNPTIPPLLDDTGLRVVPLTLPLWLASPGLSLSLHLSDDSKSTTATPNSVSLLGSTPWDGLQYGWDILSGDPPGRPFDMELSLEVLRNESDPKHPVTGLRLSCVRDMMGEYSPVCLQLANRRRDESSISSTPTPASTPTLDSGLEGLGRGAQTLLKRGLLTSLANLFSKQGEEAATAAAAAAKGTLPLVVYQEESKPASALGRTFLKGKDVYLHATLGWSTAEVGSSKAPHHHLPSKSTSLWKNLVTLLRSQGLIGLDVSESNPLVQSTLQKTLASLPFPSTIPSQYKSLSSVTPLVQRVPYKAQPKRKFLWRAFVGGNHTLLPSLLHVNLEGELRERAAAAAALDSKAGKAGGSSITSSGGEVPPMDGKEWPHFIGQVDLRLIMETSPFPTGNLPRHATPYLRVVSSPPLLPPAYLPLLGANPVRPTAERYQPLNRSATTLALRLTLAPISTGAWNMMSVMDASITTQHSLGATSKDTDDIVRLLNDTPSWMLVMLFAVTFVHLLFDALAMKADVVYWAGATTLKGISVQSLGVQALSQGVIAVYLWREGSSLLVTLPQAAYVGLSLWKMARGSGWVFGVKFWVIPTLRHDPKLQASGEEGGVGVYDREAVGAMLYILAPLLVGAAARTFLHDMHTTWGDWLLGTCVAAVYGAGFALMTPQLYMNYRLKSVAHLPWNVLGFRFFNTVIDDVFSVFVRMPLMHRISVFRDDVIFVIYLWQRWIYPVDASRPAEGFDTEGGEVAGGATTASVVSKETAEEEVEWVEEEVEEEGGEEGGQ